MITRLSKISMVFAMALFAALVSFGNITDPATNFAFVHHVFLMDTTFPGNSTTYRAIESPFIQNAGYVFIIALETLTAILCLIGGIKLLRALKADDVVFRRAKRFSIAGLTVGFLTWQVGFMSIGGEWFGMWMSKQWNGVPDASRFFTTLLLVLIYVVMTNDSIEG